MRSPNTVNILGAFPVLASQIVMIMGNENINVFANLLQNRCIVVNCNLHIKKVRERFVLWCRLKSKSLSEVTEGLRERPAVEKSFSGA